MWCIYDVVAGHFLASVSPDCAYMVTTVDVLGDEAFTLRGQRLLRAGFTAVMHWKAPAEERKVPDLVEGQLLPVLSA